MAVKSRKNGRRLAAHEGIALIRTRVSEMGYIFHDHGTDHGIDGAIEIPGTDGESLNMTVLVQCKVSGEPRFAAETEDSFQWTFTDADLQYLRGASSPAIVVISRPSEGLAWWVDA